MENRTKSILGDFDAGPRGITDRARLRKSFTSLPTEANPFWLWIPQIRLLSASSISWVTYMRVPYGKKPAPCEVGSFVCQDYGVGVAAAMGSKAGETIFVPITSPETTNSTRRFS